MAYKAVKTEHSGPKRGNGAYWGYKRDAKKESNKARRRANKICLEDLIEALGEDLKRGFALSNEMGEGWTAAINRRGSPVALFETEGEVSATGPSPVEAVERLRLELKKRKRIESKFN